MKKIIPVVITALVLIFSLNAYALTIPMSRPLPEGWDGNKWGISIDNYKGNIKFIKQLNGMDVFLDIDNSYQSLKIFPIFIYSEFGMVVMKCEKSQIFELMLSELGKKYGKPTLIDTKIVGWEEPSSNNVIICLPKRSYIVVGNLIYIQAWISIIKQADPGE